MTTVFLWCAVIGSAVLIFQLVASIAGLEHGHSQDGFHGNGAAEGLNLLSIRSIAAGLAFFGIAGLAARPFGLILASAVAVLAALGAAVVIASLVKAFGRLDRDGTLSLGAAVGTTGTVYLSIPGHRSGAGKVHLTVQNRLVECTAVTTDDPLPTGASVLVIDLEGRDTVVVVRNPILLPEVSHVVS